MNYKYRIKEVPRYGFFAQALLPVESGGESWQCIRPVRDWPDTDMIYQWILSEKQDEYFISRTREEAQELINAHREGCDFKYHYDV